MQKVTLQPGDYVATDGLSEEQYHAVARAFMNAGANGEQKDYGYEKWASMGTMSRMGWDHRDGELWDNCGCCGGFRRQLTIEQLLNATNAGDKETDMQDWKPEVGEPARVTRNPCTVLGIDRDQDKAAVKFDNGRIMLIWLGEVEPPLTEEDKAIKEMAETIGRPGSQRVIESCRKLYTAGYRKQPTEDMTDPANWRAGDVLECVAYGKVDLTVGRLYPVKRIMGDPVIDDDDDDDIARPAEYFRFHSRP